MKHVQSIAITPKTMVCALHNQKNYNPQSQPEVSESKYDVVSSDQFSVKTQRWETKTITVSLSTSRWFYLALGYSLFFVRNCAFHPFFSKQWTYVLRLSWNEMLHCNHFISVELVCLQQIPLYQCCDWLESHLKPEAFIQTNDWKSLQKWSGT